MAFSSSDLAVGTATNGMEADAQSHRTVRVTTTEEFQDQPGTRPPCVRGARLQRRRKTHEDLERGLVTLSASSPAAASLSPSARSQGVGGGSSIKGSSPWVSRRLARASKETQELLRRVTGEPGDVVRDEELAFGDAALTFKDVRFSVRKGGGRDETLILAPVSGHFEPGTLAALMGPSGSGKTTLLDILAGKKSQPYDGTVHLNGRPRDNLFQRITAYVPQHDVMPSTMTVEEAVRFVLELKQPRPSKVKDCAAATELENRLEALGLLTVRHSWIGDEQVRGISGGQFRRVSLARGLAAGAQIIFCDEPTSGLSAADAEACVRYMRLIAHRFGVTFIVVIHQPRVEVARLFDHLLLLTSNPGRVVYNGSMQGVGLHCASVGFPVPVRVNPMDHFLDAVTPGLRCSRVEPFVNYYSRECEVAMQLHVEGNLRKGGKTPMELLEAQRQRLLPFGDLPFVKDRVYGVSFAEQLRIVFNRQLILSLRNPQGVALELCGAVAKAVVLGVTYVDISSKQPQQQVAFIFMMANSCAIDGLKVMPKIIAERTVMKMETSEALYSQWAYIISFTLVAGVLSLLANTVFILLLIWISGLPWTICWHMLVWMTLLQLTFDSLYLMVAAIASDASSAQVMSMPFMLLFLLYNGFTVTKTSAPAFMQWAIRVSPMAQAMEALSVAFADVGGGGDAWEQTLAMSGYERNTGPAIVVFASCYIVFRTVQLICLRTRNNIRR
eukprot:TRINITY_DN33149_c0_g1_i1.p1 TRINITY_DN33149_c0_g1~~TRINITY_DN33149_c0_g1_i1.p1  ORF type:complete len:727 (-),score=120.39 TRINITY_DN33149_c0_g1_i1:129-2309(-)